MTADTTTTAAETQDDRDEPLPLCERCQEEFYPGDSTRTTSPTYCTSCLVQVNRDMYGRTA